jgi:predicted MFS family arabinose efflux permease
VGLILAPIVLSALGRGQLLPEHESAVGLREMAAQLRKKTVVAIYAAAAFTAMGGYAVTAFSPAFLMRTHGMSVGSAGLQLGLINGAVGVTSLLMVSLLGAHLSKKDPRWPLGVLALMFAASVPFGVAAFQVADRWAAMTCITISATMGTAYMALAVACLHSLVPPAMRAQTSAVLLFSSSIFGGLGPLFTGMLSDRLHDAYGAAALGRALLLQPVCFALSALSFVVAVSTLRGDMARTQTEAS